ncbi:hypothetical protein ABLE91_17640 [Aquabacter sp. CN5-332]|uniref:hypothetical protein n=1 Tax=Aquabacter sp. CN5-332 TaxID=3156608 RepID=UPI0032B509E9
MDQDKSVSYDAFDAIGTTPAPVSPRKAWSEPRWVEIRVADLTRSDEAGNPEGGIGQS